MTSPILRRDLLGTAAALVGTAATLPVAEAAEVKGDLPWQPSAGTPPSPVNTDPHVWLYFKPQEVAMMEAIVDRLIPADDLSIGGKDAGCAIFIDRQLAGSYGAGRVYYLKGPFRPGTPSQGPQSLETPAQKYREGLAAIAAYCAQQHGGARFETLSSADQDKLLQEAEAGAFQIGPFPSTLFFNMLVQNTREGFFADPIYGGNKDMVGWKMVGFPGARYDYRPYVERRGENLNLEPISMMDRSNERNG